MDNVECCISPIKFYVLCPTVDSLISHFCNKHDLHSMYAWEKYYYAILWPYLKLFTAKHSFIHWVFSYLLNIYFSHIIFADFSFPSFYYFQFLHTFCPIHIYSLFVCLLKTSNILKYNNIIYYAYNIYI